MMLATSFMNSWPSSLELLRTSLLLHAHLAGCPCKRYQSHLGLACARKIWSFFSLLNRCISLGVELHAFSRMTQRLEHVSMPLSRTLCREISYDTQNTPKGVETVKLHLSQLKLYLPKQLNSTKVIMMWCQFLYVNSSRHK